MKIKQKYYPELFPFIFFMIGVFYGLVMNSLDNWVSFIVFPIFLELYFLAILWFNYELRGAINERRK